MEKLTVNKKLTVVKYYLQGLSNDANAIKSGVSKGAVGNIVLELKGGGFPQVGDLTDLVETLRELAIQLKHLGMAPGQCAVGFAVIKRIQECGLEVADIERWAGILQLAGTEDKAKAFVDTVYRIQHFLNETGLTLDEIDAKILEMEEKAAQLQPTMDKVDEKNAEIAELEKKRDDLIPVVDNLEQRYSVLNPVVKDLQSRQSDLIKQIKQEEEITSSTQAALATWSKESHQLAKAGFTLDALVEFNDKIRIIAARHHIAVSALRDRLLKEMKVLDKGLTLEAMIKDKRDELKTERKAVTSTKKERKELEASNETLSEQKAALEADIKADRENVSVELANIVLAAKEMFNKFNGELQQGSANILGTVQNLKGEAIEIGKDIGRAEGIVQSNAWLIDLLALTKGDESLEAMRVRAYLLTVLRGAQSWMKANPERVAVVQNLPSTVDLLVMYLERWLI